MKWETRLALCLMLLLCLLALQACGQVPILDKIEQQYEQEQTVEDSTVCSCSYCCSILSSIGT